MFGVGVLARAKGSRVDAMGAEGAELQPIARPATNSVNIMAIVPVLMGTFYTFS